MILNDFDFNYGSCWNLKPRTGSLMDSNWSINVRVEEATVVNLGYNPERVVFNGPATIVFWPDGTKTVVKCQDDELFDPEKGVAMAILKKYFGGGKYNNVINKLIKNATYETKK